MNIHRAILHKRDQFIQQHRPSEAGHVRCELQYPDAVELYGEAGV